MGVEYAIFKYICYFLHTFLLKESHIIMLLQMLLVSYVNNQRYS